MAKCTGLDLLSNVEISTASTSVTTSPPPDLCMARGIFSHIMFHMLKCSFYIQNMHLQMWFSLLREESQSRFQLEPLFQSSVKRTHFLASEVMNRAVLEHFSNSVKFLQLLASSLYGVP